MLINGDANTSSSLQIVEPENRITFTSSLQSNSFDISHDNLNFSKDQQSISFHIEDDRKETMKETNFAHSILTNDPPKRNRKEIFSKYKINPPNDPHTKDTPTHNVDNQIMRAFDQIFSMGTPKSLSNGTIDSAKSLNSKPVAQPQILNAPKEGRPINKLMQIELKTPERVSNIATKETEKTKNNSDIGKSSQFYRTPLDLSEQKPKEHHRVNISNISDIEYRLSVIESKEVDISRDSSDFADILNAEIFKDSSTLKSPRNRPDQLIPTKDSKEPLIVDSQIQFKKAPQSSVGLAVNPTHVSPLGVQKEENMQESRFSDVYQRIDMSQSIANSILVRNQRVQIFNNGLNSNGNFLSGQNGSKMFTKSGSFGNLIAQEDETLINALGSFRMIEQACQEKRIPAYLRKAAKANSIMPNFSHPTIKLNIDSENAKLQELVQIFSQSLRFLQKMLQKIRAKQEKKKEILFSFSQGITLHKFKTCDWESCMEFQHLAHMKPGQNLLARQWNQTKVEKALANYRKIIEHHRGIRLNLSDERGIAKYFQIRKKYWDIQKNLIFITDDMYTHIMCLGFPRHMLQFKRILEEEEILFSESEIRKKKTELEQFKLLRNKNDQLCVSQVGSSVMSKLMNQIKFNSSAF